MEQRAWREVTMPALEIEMVSCSMASWILVRSWSFIWREGGGNGGERFLVGGLHTRH